MILHILFLVRTDSSNRTAAAEFFVHNGSFNGARGGDAIKEFMRSSLPTPLAQRHVYVQTRAPSCDVRSSDSRVCVRGV